MRSADALEKATRLHPDDLQGFGARLLRLVDPSRSSGVLWHGDLHGQRIARLRDGDGAVFSVNGK